MNNKFILFRRLFSLVIVAFMVAVSGIEKAKACHYAAVDIFVKYVGPTSNNCSKATPTLDYDVYFVIYNACQGCLSEVPGTTTMTVSSASAGVSITLNNQTIGSDNQLLIDTNWLNMGYPNVNPGDSSIPQGWTPPQKKYSYPKKDTVHYLCPAFSAQNSCNNLLANADIYPAFKRTVFKGHVKLPSRQSDWLFKSETYSARNPSNANCGTLYAEALLNNLDYPENSTPYFATNPLPYLCVNQPTVYLNDPRDMNPYAQQVNEYIRVFQQYPYNSFNNPCTYQTGYSLADPIGSTTTNPYKLNPITGAATFTPTYQGPFVFAFRAEMRDKLTNTLMGYVYRDVLVRVLPCSAPPPPIDSTPINITGGKLLNTENGLAVVTCPGTNLKFDVSSKGDPTHILWMYTDNNPPGSTFSVTGNAGGNPVGTLNWTPGTSDMGDHPMTVHVDDSTCNAGQAIVLKNFLVFRIKVVPGLDAGADQPICKLNGTERQLFVLGSEELKIQWSLIDGSTTGLDSPTTNHPKVKPLVTTDYVVKTDDLDPQACRAVDTVRVYVDTSNTVDVFPNDPLILCRPDYLQLDATITGTGPVSNMACGINKTNPPCAKPDTIRIYGSPAMGRIAYDGEDKTAPLMPNNVRTTKQQFLLRKEDIRQYGMLSSTLKGLGVEVKPPVYPYNPIPPTPPNPPVADPLFYQYKNLTISLKCTNLQQMSAGAGFEGSMVTVYSNPGNTLILNPGMMYFPFDKEYNWDTTQNLIVEICYSFNDSTVPHDICSNAGGAAPLLKYSQTSYVSGLSYTPYKFNTQLLQWVPDSITTSVCGVLKTGDPTDLTEKRTRPAFNFIFCEAPTLPFTLKWTPGDLLSDSTIFQPLAYVPKSVTYKLETYGRSGCILRDSVDVFVPVHNFKVGPVDSSICLGETAPMLILNGTHFIWHEYEDGKFVPATSLNCTDCANPIASPKKTTIYKVEVADSVWCFDTLQVTVNVRPVPKVHILNNDTIIKYGKPLQLLVNGARMYNWTPVASLNNPNISYPVATPTEPTMYVVAGIGTNGCRSYDTLRVGIDYRDNLFIPSAFSPNGDGKNDVFKVSNLTFQRIMEFRVFNRWGQEIFNTTDSHAGWDGTWKGVEQDMGSYQYLIRVGYPDGLVETYKGDVTLVR